jgi:hypothetical protein
MTKLHKEQLDAQPQDINSRALAKALRQLRSATIRELSAHTSLSMVTVSSLLQGLIASGVAVEDELLPSSGGRPSRLYRFNETKRKVLALYARESTEGNRYYARVANLYGEVLDSEEGELDESSPESLYPVIERLLARHGEAGAISLGLPGVAYSVSILSMDYPLFAGARVIEGFESRFRLPVVAENDVNAAAFGRGLLPDAPASEVCLYFPRSYPPGAGIRIDGRLIRGRRNFAGEVAHIPLGVPWGEAWLLESDEALTLAVASLVSSVSAVLAPDAVTLYGDFLTDSQADSVRSLVAELLPKGMAPDISLSRDFSADFERGLVALALERAERP